MIPFLKCFPGACWLILYYSERHIFMFTIVYNPLNYTITSDGRLGPWSGGPSTLLFYAIAVIPVAIVLLELAFFYYSIRDILVSGLYRITMRIIRSKFTPSENSNKTIEFVKGTYGIKIDKVDATILEGIYWA